MGVFAHAQTVDTRPLFPPPTWPGYEAIAVKARPGNEAIYALSIPITDDITISALRAHGSATDPRSWADQ